MPYIPSSDRALFYTQLAALEDIVTVHGLSNGELNYLITRIALMYVRRHGTSYNTLSDVVKALECAKLEFYRRLMAPYEDLKIEQNGDVYK
jgi:hypothetical protein